MKANGESRINFPLCICKSRHLRIENDSRGNVSAEGNSNPIDEMLIQLIGECNVTDEKKNTNTVLSIFNRVGSQFSII